MKSANARNAVGAGFVTSRIKLYKKRYNLTHEEAKECARKMWAESKPYYMSIYDMKHDFTKG